MLLTKWYVYRSIDSTVHVLQFPCSKTSSYATELPKLDINVGTQMQTCTYVPSGSKVQNVRIEHSKVRGPVRLKQLPADALLAPTF